MNKADTFTAHKMQLLYEDETHLLHGYITPTQQDNNINNP